MTNWPRLSLALAALTCAAPTTAQTLEPTTRRFVEGLRDAPPLYTLTPQAARDVLVGAQRSVPVALPATDQRDLTLPLGPTGHTDVRVIRPAGAGRALPAIVYMHGGGWVLGDRETHDRLARELAVGANAVVIFVDYARSPEARYPVAIEQGYAVLDHVARRPADFGIDANRIAVAGDSVGGNMTAVLAIMAKERRGPRLRAQLLFYPVTDATMSSRSYDEFAEGPWLTRRAMAWFWDQYLPEIARRSEVHASPINADATLLSGLPPALVIVDENDVLRDEGEAYARNLSSAGVPVVAVRYDGTIHDFMLLNPITQTPPVRGALAQAVGYLRERFAER